MPRRGTTSWMVLALAASGGCVERVVTIESEPPGALVWLNDQEVGRTPVEVEFLYYGTYDVRLQREGYEPLWTSAKASAPWWDLPGPDLVAEVLPLPLRNRILWQFALEPVRENRDELVERARELRADLAGEKP